MKTKLKNLVTQVKLLFKEIPAITALSFVVSVVLMNLLANVALVNTSWLALDAGIIISWVAFLVMDVLCKRFGTTAANILSVFAIIVNLAIIFLFNVVRWIALATPELNGWLQVGSGAGFLDIIAGDWRVVVSSTIALLVASFSQNALNGLVRRTFNKQDSFKSFVVASYVSTSMGQFVDNFLFGLFAHRVFAIWGSPLSLLQISMFALSGALVELLCEVLFSPVGYRIAKKWKEEGVGNQYLEFLHKN